MISETFIAGQIAKAIFSVYPSAKKKIDIHALKSEILSNFHEMDSMISHIRKVPTLFSGGALVDIENFFVEPKISKYNHENPKHFESEITKDDVLKEASRSEKIVILGSAGEGKSILLRSLFLQEISRGVLLPIYVELKNYGIDGTTLEERIGRQIIKMGLSSSVDTDVIRLLGREKRLLLLLDGFDEVEKSKHPQLLAEIDRIWLNFHKPPLLISSRLGAGLDASEDYSKYRIVSLKLDGIENIIRKIEKNLEDADSLIKSLSKKKGVVDLINTPLLVSILILTYKYIHELPDSLSDLYEKIFVVFDQEHDLLKPGFKRVRKFSSGANKFRSCFDALAFFSMKESNFSFTRQTLSGFSVSGLKACGISDQHVDDFIADIIDVTCLIIRDGFDNYIYIHRSIQEYHAACYIKSLPNKVDFYKKSCANSTYLSFWEKTVNFLSEIDSSCCIKNLIFPTLINIFKEESVSSKSIKYFLNENIVEQLVDSCNVVVGENQDVMKAEGSSWSGGLPHIHNMPMIGQLWFCCTPDAAFSKFILHISKEEGRIISIKDGRVFDGDKLVDVEPTRVGSSSEAGKQYTFQVKEVLLALGLYGNYKSNFNDFLNQQLMHEKIQPVCKMLENEKEISDYGF